ALAAHLAAFPAGPEGFVFTLRGEPIRRSAFGHVWRPAVAAAGLPKGTTFHTLRHYYVSLLIASGADVVTVQRLVGHKSATTTLDSYSHMFGTDADERTRNAVDRVFGESAEESLRNAEGGDTRTHRSDGR
ncbi:MAG: tyrosine-type recombinase/integrase, partial [Nocardioidaceae bacterium]